MSRLIASALLSILWALATEEFAPFNFVVGLLVSYFILYELHIRLPLSSLDPRRLFKLFLLLSYFLRELLIANILMAYYVLSPLSRIRPAIVDVPLAPMSDAELALLANLITLTPGTLSVDVAPDKSTLYVHALRVHDVQQFRRDIQVGFQRRVLEALR